MSEYSGPERREGWGDIRIHLAEIQKDISFIKENFILSERKLGKHIEEDIVVHQKVERQGVTQTLLMWMLGLLSSTFLYQLFTKKP